MKKSVKRLIYNGLLAVCGVAFLGSAGMLVHKLYEERKQDQVFSQMHDVFAQPETVIGEETESLSLQHLYRDPATGDVPQEALKEAQEAVWAEWSVRLAGYEQLWAQNHDFVGWIRIDGTMIDYPVVQSLDRPDYYLRRNFEKNSSAYGVPYVSEFSVLGSEGTNLLIYGHHMKNGSMFAALDGYRETAFTEEHSFIRFDTLEEASIYEVIGAYLIPNASSAQQVSELFQLLYPQSEADFDAGWKAVKSRLFVHRSIEPSVEQRLLALVTCDYSYNDSRIVVLAQQVME